MARSNDGRWQATCEGCGVLFNPSRAKQRYHSRDCAEEHRDQWAKPKGGARAATGLEPRICLYAGCLRNGAPFQPVRASQLTCSRRCRDSLPAARTRQRATDRHPERRERQNELRRLDSTPDAERRRFINLRSNLRRVGVEITWDDFRSWTVEGRGKSCEICGRPAAVRGIHADHDHKTLRFRGWLCHNCNRGIGMFGDDPGLLRAAAEYIERNREDPVNVRMDGTQ
jgi:Recombination endonuclease VII